jgi:hypothetical protein
VIPKPSLSRRLRRTAEPWAGAVLSTSVPSYTAPSCAVLLSAALLAALLTLAPPLRAATPRPQPPMQQSMRDLGNRVCAAHGAYCAELWRLGLDAGAPFNELISDVCLHVWAREDEDAGIACAETGIREVPSLPDAALLYRQFAPGERDNNGVWRGKPDRLWVVTVGEYFRRIPEFCDQSTPVIWDYLPCLLREVQYFQAVLKQDPLL